LADRIRRDLPNADLKLVEGRGGIFLVKSDGQTIWDKQSQNDQFPDEDFISAAIKTKLSAQNTV